MRAGMALRQVLGKDEAASEIAWLPPGARIAPARRSARGG
jgi:hypothetical protein